MCTIWFSSFHQLLTCQKAGELEKLFHVGNLGYPEAEAEPHKPGLYSSQLAGEHNVFRLSKFCSLWGVYPLKFALLEDEGKDDEATLSNWIPLICIDILLHLCNKNILSHSDLAGSDADTTTHLVKAQLQETRRWETQRTGQAEKCRIWCLTLCCEQHENTEQKETIFLTRTLQLIFQRDFSTSVWSFGFPVQGKSEGKVKISQSPKDVLWDTKTPNKTWNHDFCAGRVLQVDRAIIIPETQFSAFNGIAA